MRLDEILARRLQGHLRLSALPPAVVEDVLALAFDSMAAGNLSDLTLTEKLYDDDWQVCEGCSSFGVEDDLKRCRDEEGDVLHFCTSCHASMKAAGEDAPPP